MPDTIISGGFDFRRRMEEARESLDTLRNTGVPDIWLPYVEDEKGVEDAVDEIAGIREDLEVFNDRIHDVCRSLKYFFEDLDAAVKNNPS